MRQKALFARVPGGGIPAPSGPHLELDGGYYRCGLQLKRNGKPCKELVKIAHPPIVRRSEAFVMPGTRWLSARAARRLLPPSEAAISQCSQRMLSCRKDFEPARHVRFGSLADIARLIQDVCFTLKSGHAHNRHGRPLSANNRRDDHLPVA